ncbi:MULTISPECIES: hypothetical protein [Parabacteroides]|uniref:hypothetical protein n=1 Tax=Parabacteroides TaxID=375288 RepID=UPI000F000F3F|nr:hypothetical protein [Parabacteroides sp. AF18-52]RHR34361.1 hypothetical protein DWX23_24290 [Parabacteroides sp. AF18-52]
MKTSLSQPFSQARTLESNPRASAQAPMDEILHTYREHLGTPISLQRTFLPVGYQQRIIQRVLDKDSSDIFFREHSPNDPLACWATNQAKNKEEADLFYNLAVWSTRNNFDLEMLSDLLSLDWNSDILLAFINSLIDAPLNNETFKQKIEVARISCFCNMSIRVESFLQLPWEFDNLIALGKMLPDNLVDETFWACIRIAEIPCFINREKEVIAFALMPNWSVKKILFLAQALGTDQGGLSFQYWLLIASLPSFQNEIEAVVSLAQLSGWKDFNKFALAQLFNVSSATIFKSWINVATCHAYFENKPALVAAFAQIPNWNIDNLLLLAQALGTDQGGLSFHSWLKMASYRFFCNQVEAVVSLARLSGWDEVNKLDLAQQFDNSSEAIIENWISIATCHAYFRNKPTQVAQFVQIPKWDIDNLLLLAKALGTDQGGLSFQYWLLIASLPSFQNNVGAVVSLARLSGWRNFNKFALARLFYASSATIIETWISVATCHAYFENKPTLVAAFAQIPNWNIENLLLLAQAFAENEKGRSYQDWIIIASLPIISNNAPAVQAFARLVEWEIDSLLYLINNSVPKQWPRCSKIASLDSFINDCELVLKFANISDWKKDCLFLLAKEYSKESQHICPVETWIQLAQLPRLLENVEYVVCFVQISGWQDIIYPFIEAALTCVDSQRLFTCFNAKSALSAINDLVKVWGEIKIGKAIGLLLNAGANINDELIGVLNWLLPYDWSEKAFPLLMNNIGDVAYFNQISDWGSIIFPFLNAALLHVKPPALVTFFKTDNALPIMTSLVTKWGADGTGEAVGLALCYNGSSLPLIKELLDLALSYGWPLEGFKTGVQYRLSKNEWVEFMRITPIFQKEWDGTNSETKLVIDFGYVDLQPTEESVEIKLKIILNHIEDGHSFKYFKFTTDNCSRHQFSSMFDPGVDIATTIKTEFKTMEKEYIKAFSVMINNKFEEYQSDPINGYLAGYKWDKKIVDVSTSPEHQCCIIEVYQFFPNGGEVSSRVLMAYGYMSGKIK